MPQDVPKPPTQVNPTQVAEELQVLELKTKQLKFEYEQYFMGGRPREPVQLRGDVQKIIVRYANVGIQNTALRFKFNNLCARYYALRRHWDSVLRQIEEGTYKPHLFKAKLNERRVAPGTDNAPAAAPPAGSEGYEGSEGGDLYEAWVAARTRCGEDVKGLSRDQLERLLARQRSAIRARYGCDDVRFRVVVEHGRAKLKATPVRSSRT